MQVRTEQCRSPCAGALAPRQQAAYIQAEGREQSDIAREGRPDSCSYRPSDGRQAFRV